MSFGKPEWLLLLLVLPWVWWLGKRSLGGLPPFRRKASVALRMIVVTVLAVALAEPQRNEETDELTVFYVLDTSKSMPDHVEDPETGRMVDCKKFLFKYMREALKKDKARKPDDKAGLIVFGRDAQIEKSPDKTFVVENVHSYLSRDYTNLAGAIGLADAAFPAGSRKRMVIFTDGVENIGSAIEAARAAHGHGVDILVYPIRYPKRPEVLLERLVVPPDVRLSETFPVRVVISTEQDTTVELELFREGEMAIEQPVRLPLKKGKHVYSLYDEIEEKVGFHHYEARVKPLRPSHDTIAENNSAHAFTHIQSEASVLLVARDDKEAGPLVRALRGESIAFDRRDPEDIPTTRGAFQDYDCVILANVNSGAFIDREHMRMLEGAVKNAGVGLIMIGGEDSFGAGGYRDTPIEEALPVDMDIKHRRVMPNGALVIILHTCEIARGNYWGKVVSKAAINTLGSRDLVGLLYYDWNVGGPAWLFRLASASQKARMFPLIDKCQPGDMPDFDSTLRLAYNGLVNAPASLKHCIIISDGDAMRPNPNLISSFQAAKITISTVGIGIQNHGDPVLMNNIATSTGGTYYQPKDPKKLPQIFVKEAAVVRKSLVCNETFVPVIAHFHELIAGFTGGGFPPLEAFVITTPKEDPTVQIPMVAVIKGDSSPLLAHWKYGLGKATAFTSDATGNWAKHWVAWSRFGNFWTQVIRGTMRERKPGEVQVTTRIEGDKGIVLVDAIDDDGNFINFLDLSGRAEMPDHKTVDIKLCQVAPGRYEGEFPAEQVGIYHLTARYTDEADGSEKISFSGASVSYSPEYRSFESNDRVLGALASISGKELLKGDPAADGIFAHDLPGTYTSYPQWMKLLALAGLIFLLDVFFRRVMIDWEKVWAWTLRTGARWLPFVGKGRAQEKPDPTVAALLKKKAELREAAPKPIEVTESDFFSALKQASVRAREQVDLQPEVKKPTAADLEKAMQVPSPDKPVEKELGFTAKLLEAKRRAEEDRRRGKKS